MSTDISYNGIDMHNVLLDVPFSQNLVRDPSGTDQLRSDFVVSFETLLNVTNWNKAVASPTAHIPIGTTALTGLSSTGSQDIYNQVKGALTTDRGEFLMTMEGYTVLFADSTTDVNNGPKVLGLDITHVSSSMLRIKMKIAIALTACSTGGSNNEWPAINNRWSVTDEIDETNKTIRTWQGQLILSHLPTIRTPHVFRHLCAPALFPGFIRRRMIFTGEPSGLVLSYSITDEQMSCESPPYPASDYRIVHNKKWDTTGAKQIETISVDLVGAVLVNRNYLASRAFQILMFKGRIDTADGFARRIIRELSVTESTAPGGCTVSAYMVIEATTLQAGATMGLIDLAPIGQTLTLPQPASTSDPNYYYAGVSWLNVGPNGTGMGLIVGTLAAQWQTPCTPGHGNIQGGVAPAAGAYPVTTQPAPLVQWTQGVPTSIDPPEINSDSQQYPYHFSRMESTMDTQQGWIGLPLAAAPASGVSVVCIQVHAPTTIRKIKVRSERIGKWPTIIRNKQFTDSNNVIHYPLGQTVPVQAREKLPDGKDLYSLEYEMHFQLDRQYAANDPIPVGVLAWDTQTQADTRIPSTAFIDPDDNTKGLT